MYYDIYIFFKTLATFIKIIHRAADLLEKISNSLKIEQGLQAAVPRDALYMRFRCTMSGRIDEIGDDPVPILTVS
jgi:hypothetical protein